MFFGKRKQINEDELKILSPCDGKVKDLAKVDDAVFAEKMTGDGIAIIPKNGRILAPIKGKMKVVFDTGHAYGIKSDLGPEVLVHIGIDTVALNGQGFTKKISQGKSVKEQAEIAEVDLKVIGELAKGSDIIVILTDDSLEGKWKLEMVAKPGQEIKAGDILFKAIRKDN
ncbi:/ Mfl187 / PTS system glucose-specific transporter subunit IIA /:217584 Forward [Candidatus Hepatoplasma crinochetorum]|uniref:/ Mfl187 / PTS system glucose-specific transporter subunit IIA /:217584 Forward n=1 Tax=Candidatus Hepatoplasma crinochetorum TaxID=295596 RepID=A0A0G7ZNB4_9MOLU|nr:/ Mfl187 / PTS system glucose-specific transporter subunit IIA /:217584 Forward [Candidatus Hepatoplasma crinochetorum]